MAKTNTQYIWEKELLKIEGNLVTFKDGSTQEYTAKQMEYIVTDEPKDATAFQSLCLSAVTKDLLNVIEAHDVKKGDIDSMIQVLVWSYNESFMIAIGKAFWTYDENIHSSYYQENIRVSDIKKMIG